MLATVRLVGLSRSCVSRVTPRVTAAAARGPGSACARPTDARRTLCCSRTRLQRSGNTARDKDKRVEHVTGTWEHPSEYRHQHEPWQSSYRPGPSDQERSEAAWEAKFQKELQALRERESLKAARAAATLQSKRMVVLVMLAAVAFYLWNSQKVPLTGRYRFNFFSDDLTERLHPQGVKQMLKSIHDQGGQVLPNSDVHTRIVKSVMRRLIPVSGLTHLKWEIYVIADDSNANAFVLPGGKVFVFSGLVKMCGNEAALAAVLGHEIAHETASHVAERLSLAWVANLTTGSLFFLVGALPGLALFGIWTVSGAFVLPALMYELPMSRTHEYEADHIGLMMMAEACYNPRASIPFWQRMSQAGQEVEEVLSTHPSNSHRIERLEKLMPAALAMREQSDCKGTESFARRFRTAVKQKQTRMPTPEAI